ncbi:hypothetical protein U0E23_10020 [Burkholderia stagnalis]|uniref:hypothetical protein n=1 Tax=Burkholderia stagnalis TaxID=1503054 RepID=UPI002AB38BE1|nr:hypothetical protein [Burkholderia stagnalis]MDY7802802.1 hypothetical protein [Burkholderia stagnalis]
MHTETTADLIRWIETHNPPEPTIDNGDGTLTVACVATKDGVAFIEREKIPATRKAARDWLGY